MRINIFLAALFISFTLFALNSDNTERIGGTQLNGNGCVCHTTVESPDVHVWVEGPDTLIQGQSAVYKMYMRGGPAIAGGYNVAVRFGLLNLIDTLSLLIDNELTQAFSLPFPSVNDTIFWPFLYTAPDSVDIDTLYSVGLSTNWDSIPDDRDQWAYGPKFTVKIIENLVPVELLTFNGDLTGFTAKLNWITASEKNNLGFEVERASLSASPVRTWKRIGFVEGKGTSTSQNYYTFTDNEDLQGKVKYRLKQIDFDGSFTYSGEITLESESVDKDFSLAQNYPNPFNPSTRIKYQLLEYSHVSITVYDVLGNEVAELINEYKPVGSYEIDFKPADNIPNLASGVYYYRLQVGDYSETKKMVLVR